MNVIYSTFASVALAYSSNLAPSNSFATGCVTVPSPVFVTSIPLPNCFANANSLVVPFTFTVSPALTVGSCPINA